MGFTRYFFFFKYPAFVFVDYGTTLEFKIETFFFFYFLKVATELRKVSFTMYRTDEDIEKSIHL